MTIVLERHTSEGWHLPMVRRSRNRLKPQPVLGDVSSQMGQTLAMGFPTAPVRRHGRCGSSKPSNKQSPRRTGSQQRANTAQV